MQLEYNLDNDRVISGFEINNGHLIANYTSGVKGVKAKEFYLDKGHLIGVTNDMAKVDLGNVIGPQGPQGKTGDTGPKGDAATITVGTVTTGAAGSKATVTNAGTTAAAVLNFAIPQGVKGDTGAKGDQGITPTFSIESGHLYADYDTPYTGK